MARKVYKSVAMHRTLILDENPFPNPDNIIDHADFEFTAGAVLVREQVCARIRAKLPSEYKPCEMH